MALQYKNFSDIKSTDYDALIIGAGFAGSVVARRLAEDAGKRVLILEKRAQIAGNMYDEKDDAGILVHKYGPHIFHTNNKRAFDYALRFTEWRDYQHRVLANLNGTYIPVPFNKTSMRTVFDSETAEDYIQTLIDTFGDEKKVTITELRSLRDEKLAAIADFVYKNVFLYYTQKQWGLTPDEVDPSVVARVPVFISEDDRYFQDAYQGMPADGYTVLFENMLDHPLIDICLNVDATSVLDMRFEGTGIDAPCTAFTLKGKEFTGEIVYTGPIDELFLSRFGRLPYRSLNFEFETFDQEQYQPCGTVNYTVSEDYTRITEFKHLTGQQSDKTTIMREYSCAYTNPSEQIPYYAIVSDVNAAHYKKYADLVAGLDNFHLLGRLAEYKYYNMDAIIGRALDLADALIQKENN